MKLYVVADADELPVGLPMMAADLSQRRHSPFAMAYTQIDIPLALPIIADTRHNGALRGKLVEAGFRRVIRRWANRMKPTWHGGRWLRRHRRRCVARWANLSFQSSRGLLA